MKTKILNVISAIIVLFFLMPAMSFGLTCYDNSGNVFVNYNPCPPGSSTVDPCIANPVPGCSNYGQNNSNSPSNGTTVTTPTPTTQNSVSTACPSGYTASLDPYSGVAICTPTGSITNPSEGGYTTPFTGSPDTMGSLSPTQTQTSFPAINSVEGGYVDSCSLNPNIKGGLTLKYIIMNFIIGCVLTRTAYLIIVAAIVVFLYGIFKFVSAEGDDKQGGRELMVWGIIGIFVMVSFWGLVAILQNTFKFN